MSNNGSPSRILKVRLDMPRLPTGLIGLEKRLGVVPQGYAYLEHRPKFRARRVRHPTALVGCLGDLVNVPADRLEQRDAALERQVLLLGQRRQRSQMRARQDGDIGCWPHA